MGRYLETNNYRVKIEGRRAFWAEKVAQKGGVNITLGRTGRFWARY